MPFFGSKASHDTCSAYIQRYLEKQNRALAHDYANIQGHIAQVHWAETMDNTRKAAGCDTPWRGKQAVMYQHYILSPDPRDGVDLETLRSMTMDWVHHFFGQDGMPGALGCYEVAVTYHDDNSKRISKGKTGIPHAHIIVNNTNLAYGQEGAAGRYHRLHTDKEMAEITMPNFAQELAELRGCAYFDNPATLEEKRELEREARAQNKTRAKLLKAQTELKLSENGGRYTTKEEKAIIRAGHYSWKQDLCNQIQIARRLSTDEASFLEELNALKVGVREKGDDWVFSHPSNRERWTCTGYRLGKNYTRRAINNALLTDREKGCPRIEEVRANVTADLMEKFPVKCEIVAVYERGMDIHEVAKTLRVIDKHGIRCQADFKRLIALYEIRASQVTEESDIEYYTNRLSELREAQARSEKGDFFLGVADTHKMPEEPRYKPYASSSGKLGSGGNDADARNRQRQRNDEQTHSRSTQSHGGASHGSSGRSGARR